jgi:hypothetical protein
MVNIRKYIEGERITPDVLMLFARPWKFTVLPFEHRMEGFTDKTSGEVVHKLVIPVSINQKRFEYVVPPTSARILSHLFGTEETDEWAGKEFSFEIKAGKFKWLLPVKWGGQ